ncbi:toxic anion resistance protein [Cuneatibacter caecimuris]|uniref:Uncharacterized protein YaaN involved in tellurite resistance n=1 Tax=Cuneatibacter caecimuris TaxID=1796618 RepID=A0A4Q7NYB4_9FIRM|nr:toxic anion resistance protein [Cuneatibacter caecimuris]RZS92431.1 uncharacterized protein YaaN involved in tellurite resistance [Cuneatibacter caecimuris]
MENMEKQLQAPTLTFDPFESAETAAPAVQQAEIPAPAPEEAVLSEEEKAQVAAFAEKIELNNSQMVLQYGAGAQKKIADFSQTALDSVKTKDLGEIGEMLGGLVTELKSFDVEEEEKGLFGFFKKSANKLTSMKAKYEKADANVTKVCQVLEGHQIQLMKDVAMMDKMYELNKNYYKELTMYLLAGRKRLEKAQQVELPAMMDQAARSGLPEDAQAVNDMQAMCTRFEKKLHDLELTRMISIQMAPQIRLVQSNDTMMSEKIQSTIVNTIPLWKSQMVLALGVAHSQQAAKAQREVTDMTNELLRRNADTLKMATIETAKESERGIVDMETLKHTNESLISTLDEVMRIQDEGRQKRQTAEIELQKMENELKQKLLEIHR